jgi:5'-nucleotidase
LNILITNDDGIDFEWFIRFAALLRTLAGHTVFVIAPEGDRSGFSHSITFLSGPIRLKSRGFNIWSCSGTPVDCVMMAAMGALPFTVDLVVSGVNRGANLGTDIVYSGTAAAARQAALHRIPALAFSLAGENPFFWEAALAYAAAHIDEFAKLWRPDVFINVNLPNTPSGADGFEITFPSRRWYTDSVKTFHAPDRRQYCFMDTGPTSTEVEAGSDWDAVSRNRASVSPVFIHPVVQRDLCPIAPAYTGVDPRPAVNLNL